MPAASRSIAMADQFPTFGRLIVRTLEMPLVQTRLLTMSNNSSAKMDRRFAWALLLCASIAWSPVLAQVPDIRGGQIPTLAPVVKLDHPVSRQYLGACAGQGGQSGLPR